MPDPPSPCKARHAISPFRDWENPHPKEKARNIRYAAAKAFLRPATSPMRAKRTAHPRYESVYASAIQVTVVKESKSTPIVYIAVATIVVSTRERNKPKQRLESYEYSILAS